MCHFVREACQIAAISQLHTYWPHRDTLTVHNGPLLQDAKLVISTTMRNSVLVALHEGPLRVSSYRKRARETVWWPGLSGQINEHVKSCTICTREHANPVEPLMSSLRDHGRKLELIVLHSTKTTYFWWTTTLDLWR